jgi:hypothetical protein
MRTETRVVGAEETSDVRKQLINAFPRQRISDATIEEDFLVVSLRRLASETN